MPIKKLVRPCNYNADNQGDFHLYLKKDKKHGLWLKNKTKQNWEQKQIWTTSEIYEKGEN